MTVKLGYRLRLDTSRAGEEARAIAHFRMMKPVQFQQFPLRTANVVL
jgi:hypothetical protein